MSCAVTFNFETRDELVNFMQAVAAVPEGKQALQAVETPETQGEPAPELERPRRGRPPKAEPEKAEPKKAEPEKSKAVALGDVVAAIRNFILSDKAGNMRKVVPLMPSGKKSLDLLDLEEAQRIALALGLEC